MNTPEVKQEDMVVTQADLAMCKTPVQLLESEKFTQFLHLFNNHRFREAAGREDYGVTALEVDDIWGNPYVAKDAYDFFRTLQGHYSLEVAEKLQALLVATLGTIEESWQQFEIAHTAEREAKTLLGTPFKGQ